VRALSGQSLDSMRPALRWRGLAAGAIFVFDDDRIRVRTFRCVRLTELCGPQGDRPHPGRPKGSRPPIPRTSQDRLVRDLAPTTVPGPSNGPLMVGSVESIELAEHSGLAHLLPTPTTRCPEALGATRGDRLLTVAKFVPGANCPGAVPVEGLTRSCREREG
jgi:hypothetical protein